MELPRRDPGVEDRARPAYGNTVVLKLAQDTPLTGLHLARALGQQGCPTASSTSSSDVARAPGILS